MTDLKNHFMRLLADEPDAPDDIERIVGAGRRARRRRQVAVVTAGTVGAAGLSAAVAVPVLTTGGGATTVTVGARPSSTPTPSPSAATGKCYLTIANGDGPHALDKVMKEAAKYGKVTSVRKVPTVKGHPTIIEACTDGATPAPQKTQGIEEPAGPRYHYTEDPSAIASRLGAHLHNRVTDFGLAISYTRPFAQESANLDKGHPSYFDGNVDVHETKGYGDIGVQVTHKTTQQVPFDGDCSAADNCEQTTLDDGSVLRTGQVDAGGGDVILTAEVHRPDGVVVQAQESDYAFGPDAGTQPHGDQPLNLKQLVSLAVDEDFSF
jgi:hypothetical protein